MKLTKKKEKKNPRATTIFFNCMFPEKKKNSSTKDV